MNDERKDSGEYYPGGRQAQGGGGSGGGGDVTPKVPVTPVDELPERYRESDMRAKINQLARIISGGIAALAAMVALAAEGGITVQGARKDALWNDDFVVTNVTADLGGYATTNAVEQALEGRSEELRAEVAAATNAVAEGAAAAVQEGMAAVRGEMAAATNAAAQAADAATDAKLAGYATRAWIEGQDYVRSTNLAGYATQAWTVEQGYATRGWAEAQGWMKETNLAGYATREWVTGRGYLTGTNLAGYATRDWVQGQGYLTGTNLAEHGATMRAWVEGKGYATRTELGNVQAEIAPTVRAQVEEAVGQVVQERDVALRLEDMSDVPGQTNGWRWGNWIDGNGTKYSVDGVFDGTGTNVVGLVTNETYLATAEEVGGAESNAVAQAGAMTNALAAALENGDIGVASAQQAGYATDADFAAYLGPLGSHRGYETIFAQLDSATTTNDVCAIVTNEVDLGTYVAEVDGIRVVITNYEITYINEDKVDCDVSFYVNGERYVMEGRGGGSIAFSKVIDGRQVMTYNGWLEMPSTPDEWGELIAFEGGIAEGDYVLGGSFASTGESRNALGLARLSDLAEQGTAMEAEIEAVRGSVAAVSNEAQVVYRLFSGSNVVLEVTNYNSDVTSPKLRLLQLTESNTYDVVWCETNNLQRAVDVGRAYTASATNALAQQVSEGYAPKAWSRTTSGMGVEAPSNTTWVSTPTMVIAGGYEPEKWITSGGAVWLITSKGAMWNFSPNVTNTAFMNIAAQDGTPMFRIEKTDSYLLGVNADAVTVTNSTLYVHLDLIGANPPYVRVCTNLQNAVWYKEEDGIPAGVAVATHAQDANGWKCTIENTSGGSSLFAYFEYLQEGGTKIVNQAVMDVGQGILCKDGIHKVRPVYNNGDITWEEVP